MLGINTLQNITQPLRWCLILGWKKNPLFIHSCLFTLLFCFMSIYCGQHIREFEFVAQLEDIFILMGQLKTLHLFQDWFICFFVCHCFTLSISSFLAFSLFSVLSYAGCFISFYILQWLSRCVYFKWCCRLPLNIRNISIMYF